MTPFPGPWRPYTQMKTAAPPLEAVRTEGSVITLADGRELVDGVASWWTAVHGYNHPHIRAAVAEQLEVMPHVMFGGLTHAPAERLARRLAFSSNASGLSTVKRRSDRSIAWNARKSPWKPLAVICWSMAARMRAISACPSANTWSGVRSVLVSRCTR